MSGILELEVTADHAVPVTPSAGGTVTVLNQSGDTLYYADNAQVSAGNNQGTLTATQSATFSPPQWLRSASLSTVQVTFVDPTSSGGSVSLGSAGMRTLSGDYGLSDSSGPTANTPSIQAAINDCITNGRTLHAGGTDWRINAPLVINGRLRLAAAGGLEDHGSIVAGGVPAPLINQFVIPMGTPPIGGGGFIQTADNADILQITGAGKQVDLLELALRFANTSGPWVSTGHAVNVTPPSINAQTGHGDVDHGPIGSNWRNVRVYGHDGNHYAFVLTNPGWHVMEKCHSWGGGHLHIIQNSSQTEYGNLLLTHGYGAVLVGGTAHNLFFDNVFGFADYITFAHYQSWVMAPATPLPGTVVPTSTQWVLQYNGPTSLASNPWHHLVFLDAEWETNTGSKVNYPPGVGSFWRGRGNGSLNKPNPPALVGGSYIGNDTGTDFVCTVNVNLAAAAASATVNLNSTGSGGFLAAKAVGPTAATPGLVVPMTFYWSSGWYAGLILANSATIDSQATWQAGGF